MGGSLGKKKSKIIIVGLDNSGKSTMINLLKPKKVLVPPSWLTLPPCIVRRSGNRSDSRLQSRNLLQEQD